MSNRPDVALVHDYLTQFGGAEQVLVSLQRLFPAAPVFTTLHDPDAVLPGIDLSNVTESFLGRIPALRSNHRAALPFFPLAMRALASELRSFDSVIADSSAWAHHLPDNREQVVLVYCHSPARFLYGDPDYLSATGLHGWKRRGWDGIWSGHRWLDKRAFQRADMVLANSQLVAERLRINVGVESTVLHPPITVSAFRPPAPVAAEDWYLIVSRLVPHKKLDLVIAACTSQKIRLRIIGAGRDEPRLRAMAGPEIEFLGFQTPEQVVDHLRRCRALVLPGVEDFGMTSVEAQAAGRPVVAINSGGARETVLDGKTGVLFDEQTEASLIGAFNRLDSLQISPQTCIDHAMDFDESVFHEGIRSALAQAQSRRDNR